MSTPLFKPESIDPQQPGLSRVTAPGRARDPHRADLRRAPRDGGRACTEPELVAQWWGRGNTLDIERMEVERGGHWRYVEHGPMARPVSRAATAR